MRALLFLCAVLAGCGSNALTLQMIEQNNSGQNGTATLSDTPNGLVVEIAIKKSTVMGSQNSHIHEGRCDNVGPITAGAGEVSADQLQISSRDQNPDIQGDQIFFKTVLQTTLAKLRDHNHIINVHDSRDNTLYVSCGEID